MPSSTIINIPIPVGASAAISVLAVALYFVPWILDARAARAHTERERQQRAELPIQTPPIKLRPIQVIHSTRPGMNTSPPDEDRDQETKEEAVQEIGRAV